MRYHLILVRMSIIKKSTNNKCWRGCGEKRTLLDCWWESELVQSLKNGMKVSKRLKIELMYELAILLRGHIQSKLKFEKTHASPNSFQHYLQQSLHGSKLNSHQQMTGWKKVWYIYTQWNIIQPLKKIEIMPFAAAWMDLGIITMSEVSQTKTSIIWHGSSGKNPPAMQETEETQVWFPGSGRCPRVGNGNPLQYSCLKIWCTGEPGGYSPQRHKESETTEHVVMRHSCLYVD